MLEFIILGTLYNNACTGYDIRKCIESGIGMFYKVSFGSIYPLLARLLDNGMITLTDSSKTNRNQKKYTITEKGRTYFGTWLRKEETADDRAETFMAKVFFFDQLEEEEAIEQMERFESRVESYLDELCSKRESYLTMPNQDCFYYKLSTLYFGIAKLESLLCWCKVVKKKRCLEELVSEAKRGGK